MIPIYEIMQLLRTALKVNSLKLEDKFPKKEIIIPSHISPRSQEFDIPNIVVNILFKIVFYEKKVVDVEDTTPVDTC